MKETKGGKRGASAATIIITALAVLFAALIVYTLLEKRAAGADLPPTASAPAPSSAAAGTEAPRDAGAQDGRGGRSAVAVRVTEVVRGTIANSVVVNGDVLARNQVSIYPTVAGRLAEVRLGIGDRVNAGDVVAMVDPSRPGEFYSLSPVVSTISGTVLQVPFTAGDTIATQTAVYLVGDLSDLVIETFIPERFVNAMRRGLAAQVSLEALPGETFAAAVEELSPVLDPSSRTLKVRLRFIRRDSRIRAGMFATLSLVTNIHTEVPVVPRSSVINTYGTWVVFTVDGEGAARRHVVELGLENENFFEVLSGVEVGDRVVSAGQNFLSDGDPVRIVE
ncbi:MAG: efflux RND transporter periplasmic adaptor subunit [Treponema sp.]|nr:efflux RND transporter periplasmic adaptor subunit [Treponema sp.]